MLAVLADCTGIQARQQALGTGAAPTWNSAQNALTGLLWMVKVAVTLCAPLVACMSRISGLPCRGGRQAGRQAGSEASE